VSDARLRAARAHLRCELRESRPAIDEIFIDLECAFDSFALLLRLQTLRRSESDVEPRLLKAAGYVLLDLLGKERDKIKGSVDARKFLENFYHAPVILQGVQARPRQEVSARGGVAILGLVHVPENDKVYPAQSVAPNARMPVALPCAFSIDT
jgi:hypothetical protein